MANINWIRESTAKTAKAANRGNAEAAYDLALRHFTGREADFDPAAGYYWARYAARKGHVHAQELCGYCLVHGIGIEADGKAAVHYFMRAARRGSAVAYYNLGCCYLVGVHVPQSKRAALIWLQAAAEKGYDRAENAIRALGAQAQVARAA